MPQVRKRGNDICSGAFLPLSGSSADMPGLFNVENALAAIAVCEGLNIRSGPSMWG